MNDIGDYLGISDFNCYDYIIYDIDNPQYYDSFGIEARR